MNAMCKLPIFHKAWPLHTAQQLLLMLSDESVIQSQTGLSKELLRGQGRS